MATAFLSVQPWKDVPPTMRPDDRPAVLHTVSVDFGTVVDPETDWAEVDERLDAAGANGVELSAGRVEFTAFDWPAHPEDAAEPGRDHIARAARVLQKTSDGSVRHFGLIADAYVPEWIKEDPSIAGVLADGTRSRYQASASQLTDGAVGRRLVEFVATLGERYQPASISVTELFLNASFGEDDLELFRRMTGEAAWPLAADGRPDGDAEVVTSWRSRVVADLLDRMRRALDEVEDGRTIDLTMEVRVNWEDPAAGRPGSGHGYRTLLGSVDRLLLWAYLYRDRRPEELERLTAGLADAGLDMERFALSVGLWADRPETEQSTPIAPDRFERAVREAQTNGVSYVNVTPLSLMTQEHWEVLERLWGPKG